MMQEKILIYENNQNTIAIAKNTKHHSHTMYCNTQHHYIKQCMEKGQLEWNIIPLYRW